MQLEISLLGTPRLGTPEGTLHLTRRQPLAVLAIVALAEAPVSRDRLAFLLWPDVPQATARRRLRRTLSQLRRPFYDAGVAESLQATRSEVELCRSGCRVDVWSFRRLAAQAQSSQGAAVIAPGERAVALYQGPLLDGFTLSNAPEFESWLLIERESLARLYRETLSALVTAHATSGDLARAIHTAELLLAADPLREETHRTLMRLYAASGRRSAALQQYEECLVTLERELGVPPLPETEALYQALRQGKPPAAQPGPAEGYILSPAEGYILSPVEGYILSPVEGYILSSVEGYILSSVEGGRWPAPRSISVPCVGREAELEQVHAALTAALAGQPMVVCVSGQSGIGKTRLLREALDRLPVACWLGRGQHVGSGSPYATIAEALRTALAGVDWQLPNLSDLWLAEASRLLPELRLHRPDLRPPPDLPADQAQARFFEALTRLVVALAHAAGGAVLVLDDVDGADAASLAWLGNLPRQLQGVPLALAVTYATRPGESDAALGQWLDHLGRLGIRRDVPLPGLSSAAIAELLAALDVPPARAAGLAPPLLETTGGVPFFVLETVRALREKDPGLSAAVSRPLPLPATVLNTIQARVRALDSVTRQVLEAGAVCAPTFCFGLVRAVSGRGEEEVADALDRLVAHQFLEIGEAAEPVVEPPVYSLAHRHVAESAYAGIGAARRRLLHRRAANVLRPYLPAAAARVAHHLERAGQRDEAAAAWLAAGQQAWRLYAADDALAALDKGLALVPDDGAGAETRFELLAQREEILHHQGRREEQGATLADMEGLLGRLPPPARAETAYRRGRHHLALNRWVEAEAALQPIAQRADAALLLARTLTHQQRYVPAQEVADRVLQRAIDGQDVPAQIDALLAQAGIFQAMEDWDATEAHLRQAMALAHSHADPVRQARLTYNLGRMAFWRNRFDATLAYSLEAVDLYQAQANREREAASHVLMAMSLARLGRYGDALDVYAQARERYRAIQHKQGLAAATVNAAALALRMGQLEQGVELGRQAHELFETIGDERGCCVAASNLGAALVWLGQGAEAEPWLRRSAARAEALGLPLQQAAALANLGAALLQQGQADQARAVMEQGLAIRRELGHLALASDLAALAIACLRSGQPAEADDFSREAVALLEEGPEGVEHPQAIWFARAQVLHHLGRAPQAEEALAQAQEQMAESLAALATPKERKRYRQVFVFNRDLVTLREQGRWPQPPRLN